MLEFVEFGVGDEDWITLVERLEETDGAVEKPALEKVATDELHATFTN